MYTHNPILGIVMINTFGRALEQLQGRDKEVPSDGPSEAAVEALAAAAAENVAPPPSGEIPAWLRVAQSIIAEH